MTSAIAPSDLETLIGQIDPDRTYALPKTKLPLSYDEVVAGVRAGDFTIEAGVSRPVIRSVAHNNWPIIGSGKPITESSGPQQAALADFRRRFVDDLPELYRETLDRALGQHKDSWHYMDILFKYGLPRGGESSGMGDAIDAMRKFYEAINSQRAETRTLDV